MERMLFYLCVVVFLTGCHAVECEEIDGKEAGKKVILQINSPRSRSFNGTVAESWEKKLNTATIYIFNAAGKAVLAYTLKNSEITALNAGTASAITLWVPGSLTTCDIYMVANTTPSASFTTKASLLTSYEQNIKSYNGAYTDVTQKALRPNGFVMTGKQDGVVLNASQATNVGITLRRLVSKIAIDINFTTILDLGTLTLDSVKITNSAPYSNLFALPAANTGGGAVTLSQYPQANGTKKYRAFFYIYENDARTSASAVTINLSGKGYILILATPFRYQIPIGGDVVNQQPTRKISRNRVYYININVTKLTNILLLDAVETKSGWVAEEDLASLCSG